MKIVVLDGNTTNPGDLAWSALEALGELTVYPDTPADFVAQRATPADILITNKVKLSADLIVSLTKLKFISVLATGFNVVDVNAAQRAGIPVANVPNYSTRSVAQHVFASLLSFMNRPEAHHQAVQAGVWGESQQFCFWLNQQTELAGKTLGIVGMGQIGRKVADLAQAFGMRVIANSRTQGASLPYPEFAWCTLPQLFAEADFISLHCPLNEHTRGVVGQSLIEQMKPSAVLINTARGELIDEFCLAKALNENRIGGAVLDVVSEEPIKADNPLLLANNCLITPHLAWATIESRKRLIEMTAKNVAGFLTDQIINRVA